MAGHGRHPSACRDADVNELSDKGAKVLVLAHFGRPKGQTERGMSLSHDVEPFAAVLGRECMFVPDIDWEGDAAVVAIAPAGRYRRA
jgi:phosphoglycerate kinase